MLTLGTEEILLNPAKPRDPTAQLVRGWRDASFIATQPLTPGGWKQPAKGRTEGPAATQGPGVPASPC